MRWQNCFRLTLRSGTALAVVTFLIIPDSDARAQTPLEYTETAQSQSSIDSAEEEVSDAGGDIVVTARKRNETSMSVPVVVTAFSGEDLARRGITNLDGIARITPQLIVANQAASIQGGNVAIRGVSGPDALILADQAVAFNIDGIAISKANVRRLSTIDLSQVEVLKGPQALFYGKNSPGGVISIRTADPSDQFEAKINAGYEIVGREFRGDGYVSGPLSDTLGLRVAGYISHLGGYLEDSTPANAALKMGDRNPKVDEASVRGTVKWEPSAAFQARLKVNYGSVSGNGAAAGVQYNFCPGGVRPAGFAPDGQCTLGGSNINTGYGPLLGSLLPQTDSNNYFRSDGRAFQRQRQYLASLELNYDLSDKLSLTSLTGYYQVYVNQCTNFTNDYVRAGPSCNGMRNHQFSQETRLASDFGGAIDFVAGAYYSKSHDRAYSINVIQTAANLAAFTPTQNYNIIQKGKSFSLFAQLIVKPTDQFEIDLGGRYSHEVKRVPFARRAPPGGSLDLTLPGAVFVPGRPRIAFDDFSPEATISYRPNTDLTLFASYKRGFLSGGYNIPGATAANLTDLSYDPEEVRGFEAGMKARVFNRALRLNLAVYDYKILGLQLSNFVNSLTQTRNATSTRLRGVEADASITVPGTSLDLHASAAYNRARYGAFDNAPCYVGQTPAQGCSIRTVAGTTAAYQYLGGTELVRAPKWTLGGGASYESELGSELKLRLSADVNYSASYWADVTADPNSRQSHYALVDASARFGNERAGWEIGVFGRNLTNKYFLVSNPAVPFTGSGTGTAAGTPAARFGTVSRGREIMVQLSYKFGG